MIVLDTNVISEVMRGPSAEPAVLEWLRSLSATPVTTVVNQSEILAGIAILPDGDRRVHLQMSAEAAFGSLGACLPLTVACAAHYADIVASRRRSGRPIGGMDALVASIAREAGAVVATRDVEGFSDIGLTVVNPWT